MLLHKSTTTRVTQVFDTELNKFVSQECQDSQEVIWIDPVNEKVVDPVVNQDGKVPYLRFSMRQDGVTHWVTPPWDH